MDPLDYLVEDCWLHLFEFLSAKDKHSLCQTCESFHAMLEPEKVTWGFGLVLPYIMKEFASKYRYFDHDQRKKGVKSDLTLRQVCKAWKDEFDKYCATESFHCDYSIVSTIIRKNCFYTASKLEEFLNFFKDHQGNPFIGRNVSIQAVSIEADEQGNEESSENEEAEVNNEGNEASAEVGMEEADEWNEENEEDDDFDEEDDDFDEEEDEDWRRAQERDRRESMLKYRQLIMELLPKFGKEIDNLHLVLRCNCPQLDVCKFLKIVLCNCSNLQSLELYLHKNHRTCHNSCQEEQDNKHFEMNQLPKMDKLRDLMLSGMSAHLEKLMLEAYGPNLQSLQGSDCSEIPVTVWGNMKCLQTLDLSVSSFEKTMTILQAIKSPLETLTLRTNRHFVNRNSQKFFKIDKFLLAIQHLPLKEVEVHPEFGILKEEAPFPADFPKHQSILKFSVDDCEVYSPNFLQFLPNLETFEINGTTCLMKYSNI